MEIEITIEEMIKLMKALFGMEEHAPPRKRHRWATEVFEDTDDSQVTAPVAKEYSGRTGRAKAWTREEKAWLFSQIKPCKGNNYHIKELQQRFGVKRTNKSISACWWRFHHNN